MFFLFFQMSLCVVWSLGSTEKKEMRHSFSAGPTLKKVCGGGGVIQTQVMATDGQLLLPSTKEIFSRFGTSLFGSGPFFWFCFHGDYPDLVGSKWRFYPPIQSPSRHTVRWSTSFESPVIFLFLAITRFHFPLVPFHWARKQALCWSPLSLYQMQIDPLWLEWIRLLQPLAGEDCRKKEIWPEKRLAWNPPT